MFFEMFQARVQNLLRAKHFGTEDVARVVDTAIDFDEACIHVAVEIVEPLIIYEYADQHGQTMGMRLWQARSPIDWRGPLTSIVSALACLLKSGACGVLAGLDYCWWAGCTDKLYLLLAAKR